MNCLNCGTKLRRYKYRQGGPFSMEEYARPESQFGNYGDNCFCGLNCGYEWAIEFLRMTKEYERREEIALKELGK